MKKFNRYYLLLVLPIVSLIACNGGSDAVQEAKKENNENIDSMRDKQRNDSAALEALPSKSDADFIVNATSGALFEVALGQLARTHGRNQRVKNFGAMMEKDHSEGVKKLKELATAKGITLPQAISDQQLKEKQQLQKMKGSDFDDAYMDMMTEDHKKDLAEFEKQADKSSNPAIRAFAGDNLTMLHRHLDSALSIQKVVTIKMPATPVVPAD